MSGAQFVSRTFFIIKLRKNIKRHRVVAGGGKFFQGERVGDGEI